MPEHRRSDISLGYELCEPRNMLTVAPAADLGGVLTTGAQQAILNHLASQQETQYLQQGDNDLQLVQVDNRADSTTATFLQWHDGLPIHRTFVTVTQSGNGEILEVVDQGVPELLISDSSNPSLVQAAAIELAEQEYNGRTAPESDAHLVWFRTGDRAELAWEVDSLVVGGDYDHRNLTFTTVIDADTGSVLSQTQHAQTLATPFSNNSNINPRIVINDAIGVAGSQEFAEPFTSTVSLALGCTGTLIAENVVASARHCGTGVGDVINFGADSNTPIFSTTVTSSILPAGPGSLLDGGDLAILILADNITEDIAPISRFIDQTDELVGQVAATVGYGFNGVGSTGHEFTSDGVRWGGQNIIDAFGVPSTASGQNIISTDFDDDTAATNTIPGSDPTPIEFEATTAPGDSGSGIFVNVGGEWVIAGVLSGGTDQAGFYGDISWWTGTAAFRADIEAVGGEFITFGDIEVSTNDTVLQNGEAVEFGTVALGETITQTFTVQNVAETGALELFEPIIVPDGFSVTRGFGTQSLAPGESTTFEVRLDSNPIGTYRGDVVIQSGDAEDGFFRIPISATVAPSIGEAATIQIGRSWTTIFLRNTYIDPVVVAGPPGSVEADPVTVRVRNVTADSFEIRLHEWQYLDGPHATESVSYAVLESGTHRLTDGTTIVAGNVDGIETAFSSVDFDLAFTQTPVVLSQVTTVNGGAPVITRTDNVDREGFSIKIQEEEAADNLHNPETVSFLAFVPGDEQLGNLRQTTQLHVQAVDEVVASLPFGSGRFDQTPVFLGNLQSTRGTNTAALRVASINNESVEVFVQEEQSRDLEVGHGNETVGFLALEQGDIIGRTVIGEAGRVEDLTGEWQTIQLQDSYIDPVVVFTVSSINDSDPGTIRVRNVTSNSFQVRFEEWNYLDLNHAPEIGSFVVLEVGTHRLRDGTIIEARNSTTDSDFTTINFNEDYDSAPLVFSQVASDNGPSTVTTRIRNIDSEGFEIKVQEEEGSSSPNHVNETISWFTVRSSSGGADDLRFEAKPASPDVNHRGEDILFSSFFEDAPVVLANQQTFRGNNTATVRVSEVSSTGVSLFIEEEQSFDNEIGHGREQVGIFAVSAGVIDGFILDLYDEPAGFGGFSGFSAPRSAATADMIADNAIAQAFADDEGASDPFVARNQNIQQMLLASKDAGESNLPSIDSVFGQYLQASQLDVANGGTAVLASVNNLSLDSSGAETFDVDDYQTSNADDADTEFTLYGIDAVDQPGDQLQ